MLKFRCSIVVQPKLGDEAICVRMCVCRYCGKSACASVVRTKQKLEQLCLCIRVCVWVLHMLTVQDMCVVNTVCAPRTDERKEVGGQEVKNKRNASPDLLKTWVIRGRKDGRERWTSFDEREKLNQVEMRIE